MGVREIDREMGKDFVHMLGSVAPRRPEVKDNWCSLLDHLSKLLLGLQIFRKPNHLSLLLLFWWSSSLGARGDVKGLWE